MSTRCRWLSFVAVALLAVACGGGDSPLQEAVAGLEKARSYQVEYELFTFFEGTAKPVEASGKIEFEGTGRWRISQDSIEMVVAGSKIYVKDADIWRTEEMVELPINPLLYLKAATDVRRTGSGEGNRTFAFALDRGKYRAALEQAVGAVPRDLDHVIARFRGAGEVTLGAGGWPASVRLHLADSSLDAGRVRQELEIRFLDTAGDYDVPVYVGARRFPRGGEAL